MRWLAPIADIIASHYSWRRSDTWYAFPTFGARDRVGCDGRQFECGADPSVTSEFAFFTYPCRVTDQVFRHHLIVFPFHVSILFSHVSLCMHCTSAVFRPYSFVFFAQISSVCACLHACSLCRCRYSAKPISRLFRYASIYVTTSTNLASSP